MAKPSKKESSTEIEVVQIDVKRVRFYLLGQSPIIFNCMSAKAKHELLLPKAKQSKQDRAKTLKHDPLAEYRESVYRSLPGSDEPTRLLFPATGIKAALRDAAIDFGTGTSKAEMGRLVYAPANYVNVYGIPKMLMSVVRSKDMNRTPDIRTRAIVPEWCAHIDLQFVAPVVTVKALAGLLVAAGITRGIGDWRPEKGSGSHGQFKIVAEDDPDFRRIVKTGGIAAQDAALERPEPFDVETQSLYDWYMAEVARRRDAPPPEAKRGKKADKITSLSS